MNKNSVITAKKQNDGSVNINVPEEHHLYDFLSKVGILNVTDLIDGGEKQEEDLVEDLKSDKKRRGESSYRKINRFVERNKIYWKR